jgi:hypothetical protein
MSDYIIRWSRQYLPPEVEEYEVSEDLNNCIDYVLLHWRHSYTEWVLTQSVNILCPKNDCIMVTLSHCGETKDFYFVNVVKSLSNLAISQLFLCVNIASINKATGEVKWVTNTEVIQYHGIQ